MYSATDVYLAPSGAMTPTRHQRQPEVSCLTSSSSGTDLELSADNATSLTDEQCRGGVKDELAGHPRREHRGVLGAVEV